MLSILCEKIESPSCVADYSISKNCNLFANIAN